MNSAATWTKLPAGSDEIAKTGDLLLHVAGSRGSWHFSVTRGGQGRGFVTVATGSAKTKAEAKQSAYVSSVWARALAGISL